MMSWTQKQRLLLLLPPVVVLGVLIIQQHLTPTAQVSWTHSHKSMSKCGIKVSSYMFNPVQGSKTLVINAVQDHRTAAASIRLISIVLQKEDKHMNCVLCCHNDTQLVTVAAERNPHSSHFNFPYSTGDFLCQIPPNCQARYAGLVSEDMNQTKIHILPVLNQVKRQSNFPLNFTICISTMFHRYDNVLQFIQAMELYRLLGAQKVIVYKNSCSPAMEEVLQYYNQVGLVEVLSWPITDHLNVSSSWLPSLSPGDIHYYGQIPANNDCVYRYMHKSRYLLMHDADEVILPTGSDSWAELMSTLESKYGENSNYYFPNNIFRLEEKDEDSRFDLPEWKGLPGNNMLLHVLREPTDFDTGKQIVNPRSILEMEVHSIRKYVDGGLTVQIGPELGWLYHVRRKKKTALQRNELIRDEGLLRFAPQLVRQVNTALRNMNLLKD